MRTLFFLLVVAAVVAIVWWTIRHRSRPAQRRADPLRPDETSIDVRRLKVGDVVGFAGTDSLVRGTLRFDQDGFVWHEHLLDDANVRRWLSVEEDEELEVCLWRSASGGELTPGARSITYDGVTYELEDHGRARYTAEGTTGTGPSGQVEYYDYAAGDKRLSFERYGDTSWEVGVGEVVSPRSLDIYPVSE